MLLCLLLMAAWSTSTPTATRSRTPSPARVWPSPSTTPTQTVPSDFSLPRQLMGRYIRAGVTPFGTLGSFASTPPGLQYDATGWGRFFDDADWLTPGSPMEGYSVSGIVAGATFLDFGSNEDWSTLVFRFAGWTFFSFDGVERGGETWDQRGVFTGARNDDSGRLMYTLEHDVRLNRDDQHISIRTTITAGPRPLRDLKFSRFIDPDVMHTLGPRGDTQVTSNMRGLFPIGRRNVVFAEALASKYVLGLYSTAPPQSVGMSVSCPPWTQDPEVFFRSDTDAVGDCLIGVGFNATSLPALSRVSFCYAYVLGSTRASAGAYAVSKVAGGLCPTSKSTSASVTASHATHSATPSRSMSPSASVSGDGGAALAAAAAAEAVREAGRSNGAAGGVAGGVCIAALFLLLALRQKRDAAAPPKEAAQRRIAGGEAGTEIGARVRNPMVAAAPKRPQRASLVGVPGPRAPPRAASHGNMRQTPHAPRSMRTSLPRVASQGSLPRVPSLQISRQPTGLLPPPPLSTARSGATLRPASHHDSALAQVAASPDVPRAPSSAAGATALLGVQPIAAQAVLLARAASFKTTWQPTRVLRD